MKVLALDFDGVICNSAREVFVTGVRTYASLVPDSRLVNGHAVLGEDQGLPTLDFEADPIFQAFENLVPLGNRAEDFGVALRTIEEEVEVPDQEAYDAFMSLQQESWLDEYHRRFYDHREQLRRRSLATWIRLHRPYSWFGDLLRRHADTTRLAVATAKDSRSVRLLLHDFGIDGLFADDLVLDKDTGVHKTAHLEALQGLLDVDFAQITFVDDKVNHLQRVAPLGVRPVLAGWGYNTERERVITRGLGYEIATRETAESMLFS
jgi:phosphoglycolate phosphatase-like HAD superfamily hydrolase